MSLIIINIVFINLLYAYFVVSFIYKFTFTNFTQRVVYSMLRVTGTCLLILGYPYLYYSKRYF